VYRLQQMSRRLPFDDVMANVGAFKRWMESYVGVNQGRRTPISVLRPRQRAWGEPMDQRNSGPDQRTDTGAELAHCRNEPKLKAHLTKCVLGELTLMVVRRNRAHQSGQDLRDGRVRIRAAARSNRKPRAHRTLIHHQVAFVALVNPHAPIFLII